MSATPPSTIQGTETPSPFEVLWDRYRTLIIVVIAAILLAVVGNALWTRMEQGKRDEKWSAFNASIGVTGAYTDIAKGGQGLSEALEDVELSSLESALAGADDGQKPYYQLAIARKAMLEKDWDRAEQALSSIESDYPQHVLVAVKKDAVQTRDEEKPEKDEAPRTELKFVDPVEGSIVSLMRKEIAAARDFVTPKAFEKPAVPEDAKKVKIAFGDFGSFTIALTGDAKKHQEKFLELVTKDEGAHFKDIAVDEVRRPTERIPFQPMAVHFGFESTKKDDRSEWTTTEPSNNVLDFEDSGLSHFNGAVSFRPEAEGKSCADRLWISIDDEFDEDGSRVILGFVVDGMDVLRAIADTGLSANEEEQGRGRPIENIRVTEVGVLE